MGLRLQINRAPKTWKNCLTDQFYQKVVRRFEDDFYWFEGTFVCLEDGQPRPLFNTGNNMGPIVNKLGSDAIALGYDNDLIPQSYEVQASHIQYLLGILWTVN